MCVQDSGTPSVTRYAAGFAPHAQYANGGDWGSTIWIDGQGFSTGWTYATAVTPVSNITTGSGTRFDPYVITTVIDLGSIGVRLTQSFRYTRAAIHIFTRAGGSRIAASARTRR